MSKEMEFWNKVNEECEEDIIDIVMDLIGENVSAGETMERIFKRCEITKKLMSNECDEIQHTLIELIKSNNDICMVSPCGGCNCGDKGCVESYINFFKQPKRIK